MSKTTIVTAIPYVNSTPHIGNILTTLSGDVCARFHKMRGDDVFFVVGTDENGQKIKEAAESQGREVGAFVEEIAGRFKSIFAGMDIREDEFVRTSLERHRHVSQQFFQQLLDNGYIYKANYEGWYDVSTETYFKESDLVDGKSPDGNPVRLVQEENYFFKLSAFEDRLLAHIEAHPDFIIPETRKNEVLSFIKGGLKDQAVSRTNNGWGIPILGDESQVIYVWFDALINYVTATGWPNEGYETKWPALVQWLGKDILTRFHATLWPAMLWGVGLEAPKHVVAHAWVLHGGEKLSKSQGNVIQPIELAQDLAARAGVDQTIAVDVLRYYLVATMGFENDSTFTYEDFDKRYNSDLANDIGNALNRSLAMAHKFVEGIIPDAEIEPEALHAIQDAKKNYEIAMAGFRLERAQTAAFGLVRFLNKYIDTRAPWALAKAGDPALASVIRSMLLCLRSAEGLVRPAMPTVSAKISAQLGVEPITDWNHIGDSASLVAGTRLSQPQPIFPRLEIAKPEPVAKAPKFDKAAEKAKSMNTNTEAKETTPAATPAPAPAAVSAAEGVVDIIGIEDFMKVKLRVGRVLEAEAVEASDKLLKLQIMIGDEKRQIVAGIRKNYTPEDLIARQVIVVYNLKPVKLRGVESQGMLLAATDAEGGAILLQPDREAPEGTQVR